MPKPRIWELFPDSYRSEQMQQLAKWIHAGENCSVIGLAGCGRSNLLQFLCYRPEVLQSYLPTEHNPIIAILVDLNDLPATDPTTLYLVILREFYWARNRFSETLKTAITSLFTEYRATENAFLAQTALHEFILTCQTEQTQVVLVFNHFDTFAQTVPRQTLATLRSLRDKFKDSLLFMGGMMQEFRYLPPMDELISRHICWVGPMNKDDARN
ncbi:MAG: ATP-binding protein, partial [Anaerolineae bacterium]|nr:ATP-binding protein [Anaerolineae bacterium]